MYDPDYKRAQAEFQTVVRVRGVGLTSLVKMWMFMPEAAVLVRVHVKLRAVHKFAQSVDAEHNQHQSYTKLEYLSCAWSDLKVKEDHQHTCGHERGRVSQSPERANQCGTEQAATLCGHGRNCREMIGIESMLDTEHEPEGE